MDSNDFHLKQSPYSDPGAVPADLPADPRELAALVRNLLIHREEGGHFGYAMPEERRREDAEARYVSEILRILRERSRAPLTEHRELGERFAGTCRDFALLMCAFLRATGTPARVRCGFATYFEDGSSPVTHGDHWVTEYRLPDGSWRLADAQVADGAHDVPFDPLDVPRDQFLVAGAAWRACRAGDADPDAFGIPLPTGTLQGLWFVRGNVVRDLAALGGVEVLPWDAWGLAAKGEPEVTADDLALLDAVAAATAPSITSATSTTSALPTMSAVSAVSTEEIRRLCADPHLTVPAEITSHTTYLGVRQVRLPESLRG
ncbi:transglutaminase domain-containing protein [Streptomyces phaeochromogenes]|uniref:transglutaminase-like domain-containing protein n=1 Tax=Streptomyces phaeochromogenes TaxID=1923 RepID=UPI00225791F3|nr:transglutaminase domain-containing protein [Streptomyces phaeochromogenes]MCX5600736.1 transglutaminase domain-containing protein [Streptomyces phaeochromogenes]